MVRSCFTAAFLLTAVAFAGCDSSALDQQDGGVDGGYVPTASCQGVASECGCTTDADCTLSLYPKNVARTQECYCVASCAYNPVRTDADAARASAFATYCEGDNGIADGGCPTNPSSCQPFTAFCWQGSCAAQAQPVDAGP